MLGGSSWLNHPYVWACLTFHVLLPWDGKAGKSWVGILPSLRNCVCGLPGDSWAHKFLVEGKRTQGLRSAHRSFVNRHIFTVFTRSSNNGHDLLSLLLNLTLCSHIDLSFPWLLGSIPQRMSKHSHHGWVATELPGRKYSSCTFWSSQRCQYCAFPLGLCKQMFWQLVVAACDSFPWNYWTSAPTGVLKRRLCSLMAALLKVREVLVYIASNWRDPSFFF